MVKAKPSTISRRKSGTTSRGMTDGVDTRVNKVVMAPVAQNRSAGQTRGNSLRFKECERISTVNGSIAFSVTGSQPCNPALSGSFPWLSGHAALFERYRVHKLVYRYKNLKGTATNGNILMSFDYDTLDNSPATAIEMTQSTVYADGAPWRIFELNVPTDKRDLFTRTGTVSGADLKTYDMGKLNIAAEGCADTSPHGYLEVEYDIELFMKQSIASGTTASTGSGQVLAGVLTGLTGSAVMTSTTVMTVQPGTYVAQFNAAWTIAGATPTFQNLVPASTVVSTIISSTPFTITTAAAMNGNIIKEA